MQKKTKGIINNVMELYENTNILHKTICNDFLRSSYSDNYPINPDIKLMPNQVDTIMLHNLVDNKNKMIVYYSNLHCSVCIDFQLNIIKEYLNELKKDNVIFVASYSNFREQLIDAKITALGCPIYYIGSNSFQLPIEELNEPFFFLIDKNMYAKHVFVPRKEMPELAKNYLIMICEKYFSADIYKTNMH
jgi:hypothetical protein